MFKRVVCTHHTLITTPSELHRITLAMTSGNKRPADRVRAQLDTNSPEQNTQMAQQWAEILKLIFSKETRDTSKRILQDDYDFAAISAEPMYKAREPTAHTLKLLLDVAPEPLINYVIALTRYGCLRDMDG